MAAVIRSRGERPLEEVAPERSWGGWRLVLAGSAAAAAAVVLVLLGPLGRDGQVVAPPDRLRDSGSQKIESLLDESEPLDRVECWLRWVPGPGGTLYTVEVLGEDLTLLDRAEEIEASAYRVPESILEGVPDGGRFLWRVEATLPDRTHLSSPVFRAVLE